MNYPPLPPIVGSIEEENEALQEELTKARERIRELERRLIDYRVKEQIRLRVKAIAREMDAAKCANCDGSRFVCGWCEQPPKYCECDRGNFRPCPCC